MFLQGEETGGRGGGVENDGGRGVENLGGIEDGGYPISCIVCIGIDCVYARNN